MGETSNNNEKFIIEVALLFWERGSSDVYIFDKRNNILFHLRLVCEFGGEGKGRLWGVENMRKNEEIFQKI